MSSRGLGRWVNHDPASRRFPVRARAGRRSVLHDTGAPVSDQGNYGACVGFTVLDVLNTRAFARSRRLTLGSGRYLPNSLGLDFYAACTQVDEWPGQEWPPDDTGSSLLSACRVMKDAGYIDSYRWAFSFGALLGALERQPVMLATLWASGMDDPVSSGVVRPTGDLDGGHAYMARGVDYSRERVRCRNHWTRDWGVGGEFYLSFADLEWLFAQQGECAVPTPLSP